MHATLNIEVSRDVFAAIEATTAGTPRLVMDVSYLEDVRPEEERKTGEPEIVPRSRRVQMTAPGVLQIDVGTPLESVVQLSLLNSDGSASTTRVLMLEDNGAKYAITKADIDALALGEAPRPAPAPLLVERQAQLVPIGKVRPDFKRSQLAVLILRAEDETIFGSNGALAAFGFDKGRSSAVTLDTSSAEDLQALAWRTVAVGIDGRFAARFERSLGPDGAPLDTVIGWLWWLNGAHAALGFVKDDVLSRDRQARIIALPALQDPASETPSPDCNCPPTSLPDAVVSETELVNNPGIYSEDPGAFCKPFSNPERVISEKAFAVIARVQQPEIGPLGAARLRTQHLLDLDATLSEVRTRGDSKDVVVLQAPSRDALTAALLGFNRPKRFKEPAAALEEVAQLPSGRTDMNAQHPIQWEDDIAQYQAATVALGHILEFRIRTRSNGYSLGNVASTLTLAPRQTKRIQKIEFERLERSRRDELQQQRDRVSDEVVRERDYNDTVSAYLNEWATGSSSSGTAAAAGGFGFALPPIVGGVGGGTSSAWSESTQSGTRNTGASEQQRLRDAIRRHGDSLRQLQSTVVTEVTQQETVTGTTETLRNPNYGHSLTVIYYQILRHLAVSTEFAGVRECLFVPFAIKPFSLQRAYRWREALSRYLRQPRFANAMALLRDVITDFVYSKTAPGVRSQHKLTHLQGSVYLQLAVERPKDNAGAFDAARWLGVSTFLGQPAYGIWARLAELVDAQRDQLFQREHAPTIAAKWANSLRLLATGIDLNADFTLATRYSYNQPVRIDFNVPVAEANKQDRARLVAMIVKASTALPEGSVAKVTRLSLRYGTATFQRTLDASIGADDILEPGSAAPDPGAQVVLPLDDWDQVNERESMRHSVSELIEHLNEHVEFYHKAIWWSMDRDRLLMMLDGFYVPGTNRLSIASVVDREPVAILGNCLVYRVGAGTFIGHGKIATPADLYEAYAGREPVLDPLLISLPTDGLYAQTIMDECLALEEHEGSIDWVLNDPDPELGTLDPSLLQSRRADTSGPLTPTNMPATIINLQNAPDAPAPSGLQGVLSAVANPGAFRDMAGLAGTQANAAAALTTAANMATQFSSQAAALKLAELASKAKAAQDANRKLAAVKKAKDEELISAEDAAGHTNKILNDMHTTEGGEEQTETLDTLAQQLLDQGRSGTVAQTGATGTRLIDIKPAEFQAEGSSISTQPTIVVNANVGSNSKGRVAILSFGTFKETNRFKTESFRKGFFDTDVLFNFDPTELLHRDGVGLVQMAGAESVFRLFRTEPDDSSEAEKRRKKSKRLWKKTLPSGDTYKAKFEEWVNAALQDNIDCLYLTGHHWEPTTKSFNLSAGVFAASFRFTGERGNSDVNIGYSGSLDLTFDIMPIRNRCKLIFGFGCDLATADASLTYQDVFGRGAGDVPVVCGWNTTVGLPSWNQADRSPNVRYFEFLESFATANINPATPPTNLLQWFYDNHPMELVRAWGHATQRWNKNSARARGKDGKLYKFKLDAGQIKAEETTS